MAWVKGQSGNPSGKRTGTRDKITEAFLRDLEKLWRESGEGILQQAATKDPAGMAKLVASLLPKEVLVDRSPLADYSNEQLADLLARIEAALGDDAAGNTDGAGDTGQPQPSGDVSTVH